MAQGIEELAAEDAAAAADALENLLASDDIRDLINPEIIALLQNSPTPEYHVNDILDGIKKLGAFESNDDIIFIRPGLLDFAALGENSAVALANLGCEEVVYVTRTGEESGFAMGVAKLLGMSGDDEGALYDLDSDSAYSLLIAEADATWCTNWNEMDALNLPAISADGYNAPMESSSECFTADERPYHGTSETIGKRGCSPGAQ